MLMLAAETPSPTDDAAEIDASVIGPFDDITV